MKRILGLDLGTSSIGWALVNEGESANEQSSIVKLGVRIIEYDTFTNREGQEIQGNPADYFSAGKSVSPNAARTKARSMRRNLQRYKQRRNTLIATLKEHNIINDSSLLYESGHNSTYQTLALRAKSATEEISLSEFARVLININKKRGYKSSRKVKSGEDGTLVDGIAIAKQLYEEDLTPGQFVFRRLNQDKFNIPDFYRSDLVLEFDRIWEHQRSYYPSILTDDLKNSLYDKNKSQTWAICREPFGIVGMKRTLKGRDLLKENYRFRNDALSSKLSLEELAIVLQEINSQIRNSSGYLGSISDRSKILHFNNMTVGQWMMQQLNENRHYSLKNKTFFRQDYMDEFERIWEVQSRYHSELTPELKKDIRDIVIFYQRPLRSQKGLVSYCEFEHRDIKIIKNGKETTKTVGLKVCPKSSPLFQEFKIWQILNNLKVDGQYLHQEEKDKIFKELNIRGKLSDKEILKLLFPNRKGLSLNFKSIDGNNTQVRLFQAYSKILVANGYDEYNFSKMSAGDSLDTVQEIFESKGWKTDFLLFNSDLEGDEFEKQPHYRLWHLLYSYEGDKSISGNASLIKSLQDITGMDEESAGILASVSFEQDYGSLSAKAMKKILPYMREGNEYSLACAYAGYRHSAASLTKEELQKKVYADRIAILPRNSLRNPMVEKILNQMANVVNRVIDSYGKPDEIRIELARELKNNAEERRKIHEEISKSTAEYENYRKILKDEFHIENPSRNDLTRYRLYLELKDNGFHTLYSNTYIPREKLFSKEFDIEHIIPQAKLFDDSFSNKTLESRQINIEKSKKTALDFVEGKYSADYIEEYKARVEKLFKENAISKSKRNKLLMKEADIPQGFIARDLRDTQYISKKAKQMLEAIVPFVVTTTGSVTNRLREDWQLVDVMRELNWDKFDKLGMTYYETDADGRRIPKIRDWTKRNGHRHHAMDALTIAFTKRSYIQYLNNLNARVSRQSYDGSYVDLDQYGVADIPPAERTSVVMFVEANQMYRDSKGKLRFIPPIPLDIFRKQAESKMSEILVSFKSKGKVMTRNVNISKKNKGTNKKIQLTPRGQLHNETVYGHILKAVYKDEKVGAAFDSGKIASVVCGRYRKALMDRLEQFGGDANKAFCGKNSLDKNPIWLDDAHSESVPDKVKTMVYEDIFTKREAISPELKLEKVVDEGIRKILAARLAEYGNDAKKSFSNLDDNPIWLDKEHGISIKRVTLTGKSNVISLHDKKDHTGSFILDEAGKRIPGDFICTGSNHHVAIYRDADGNLQEKVVSFLEAVARFSDGIPVIDTEYKLDEGWEFLFSMKQNEYFVFPNPQTGFDPHQIDLLDPKNYSIISPNLFRVQKLTTRDYFFRHHLETTINNDSNLKDITWKRITSPNNLKDAVKVHINHIGEILKIGE